MWSLFAKFEGLDEKEEFYLYSAPTLVDKSRQAKLFWGKNDLKLKKVSYGGMEFKVDVFDTCKLINDVFSY